MSIWSMLAYNHNTHFIVSNVVAPQTKKTTAFLQSSGELAGARTQDPNIKSVVLYLLSYEFIAPNHFLVVQRYNNFLNCQNNLLNFTKKCHVG